MRNEDAEIGGACQAEMKSHRKMLMEDYSISPELVSKCRDDIDNNCKQSHNNPGEIIHCLLRYVPLSIVLKTKKNPANVKILT